MSDFDTLIKLYRLTESPTIINSVLSGTIKLDKESLSTVQSCHSFNSDRGRFQDISVNNSFTEVDELVVGNLISYQWKISTNNDFGRFYQNIEDFITKAKTISEGKIPDNYFIVDLDYSSSDKEQYKPNKIKNLETICKLIQQLSLLAQYHDKKSNSDGLRLVFVQNEKSRELSATFLETKISNNLLAFKRLDIGILDQLTNEYFQKEIHIPEKKSIFIATLSEFLNKVTQTDYRFSFLVENWDSFLDQYQKNYDIFISGFAFSEVKMEIAKAEIQFTEQTSKIIKDITAQLFSLPISFAAIIAGSKTTSILEAILYVTAAALASLIITGSIRNQQKQLMHVAHSRDIVFTSHEDKMSSYPDDLKESLKSALKKLREDENYLKNLLWFFRSSGWSPVIISVLLFINLFLSPPSLLEGLIPTFILFVYLFYSLWKRNEKYQNVFLHTGLINKLRS